MGDLVEEFIFNIYKERELKNISALRKEIYDNYKYELTYDLYTRIVNYQIDKYGCTIQSKGETNYVRNFLQKGKRSREYTKEAVSRKEKLNNFIERVENEKDKRKKTTKRKKS